MGIEVVLKSDNLEKRETYILHDMNGMFSQTLPRTWRCSLKGKRSHFKSIALERITCESLPITRETILGGAGEGDLLYVTTAAGVVRLHMINVSSLCWAFGNLTIGILTSASIFREEWSRYVSKVNWKPLRPSLLGGRNVMAVSGRKETGDEQAFQTVELQNESKDWKEKKR